MKEAILNVKINVKFVFMAIGQFSNSCRFSILPY